jgi:hypothetical protein
VKKFDYGSEDRLAAANRENVDLRRPRHEPQLVERQANGSWGVICAACSAADGDYVTECREGVRMPAGPLVPGAQRDSALADIRLYEQQRDELRGEVERLRSVMHDWAGDMGSTAGRIERLEAENADLREKVVALSRVKDTDYEVFALDGEAHVVLRHEQVSYDEPPNDELMGSVAHMIRLLESTQAERDDLRAECASLWQQVADAEAKAAAARDEVGRTWALCDRYGIVSLDDALAEWAQPEPDVRPIAARFYPDFEEEPLVMVDVDDEPPASDVHNCVPEGCSECQPPKEDPNE